MEERVVVRSGERSSYDVTGNVTIKKWMSKQRAAA
jgi:hypothetical protein